MDAVEPVRFVPSRVDGLDGVSEVAVHPDRIELTAGGQVVAIRFADIARWPWPTALYRWRHRRGWRGWLPVADRDWFRPPADRFFRFATDPPLTVYMPADGPDDRYTTTTFRRAAAVIAAGGFATSDLG